jgi:hypothetical protein
MVEGGDTIFVELQPNKKSTLINSLNVLLQARSERKPTRQTGPWILLNLDWIKAGTDRYRAYKEGTLKIGDPSWTARYSGKSGPCWMIKGKRLRKPDRLIP